jgi:hypothetical protein
MPTDPEERIRRLIAKVLAIGAIAIALTFINHGFYHLHSGYMDDPRWKFRVWEGGGARSQAARVIVPFIISILPYGLIGFGILGICFYYNILRDGGVIKIKDKDRE